MQSAFERTDYSDCSRGEDGLERIFSNNLLSGEKLFFQEREELHFFR